MLSIKEAIKDALDGMNSAIAGDDSWRQDECDLTGVPYDLFMGVDYF